MLSKEFYNLKLNIMKKEFAMSCNQKQFESIKSKIDHLDVFMIEEFRENFYLVLFEDMSITNGTIKDYDGYKYEIHETWNEKVFLEACGIEVEEPKEESFVITREQIYDLCHPSLKTNRERLEVYFPSCFEPEKKELVVGKWYTCGDNCIFNHQDKNSSYGVLKGQWIQKWGTNPEYFAEPIIEATQQEVEEALKAEILKRYKVGDLVYLKDGEGETKKLLLDEFKYYPKDNQMYVSTEGLRMAKMFDNGIFAEIIQPKKMTKAEAEIMYNIEIV